MTITASYEALMRQASMTIDDYLFEAITRIDKHFGEGYAKANPSLVGAFITASASDFNNASTIKAIQDAADKIADALSGD